MQVRFCTMLKPVSWYCAVIIAQRSSYRQDGLINFVNYIDFNVKIYSIMYMYYAFRRLESMETVPWKTNSTYLIGLSWCLPKGNGRRFTHEKGNPIWNLGMKTWNWRGGDVRSRRYTGRILTEEFIKTHRHMGMKYRKDVFEKPVFCRLLWFVSLSAKLRSA